MRVDEPTLSMVAALRSDVSFSGERLRIMRHCPLNSSSSATSRRISGVMLKTGGNTAALADCLADYSRLWLIFQRALDLLPPWISEVVLYASDEGRSVNPHCHSSLISVALWRARWKRSSVVPFADFTLVLSEAGVGFCEEPRACQAMKAFEWPSSMRFG